MTEDYWSLKGKGKGKTRMNYDFIDDKWNLCYMDADIETLRQKLIEDMKREAMKAGNEICWQDCKTIINDRFGVEE
jgi:shikimate kinase